MRKIFLVIVHFKDKQLTEQCLESVEHLKIKDFRLQLVVVNNNPQEDLADLEKKFKKFVFLKTEENLGFTGANNLGIKRALEMEVDWVFLVNNDTVLDRDLLINLMKAAKLDEKIGVLGPKIYFAPGYEYHQGRYKQNEQGKVFWYAGGQIDWQNVLLSHRGVDEVDQGQYDEQEGTDFASGCAMLIKKEVLEKIGLLDDRYFLYLEDSDFCQRAKKAGFGVLYAPQAKLWHLNAGSSEVGGPLHDYFFTRNRLVFGLRHAPFKAKLALLRESVKLLITGRPWQKRGVKDFYCRKFGKGSWREEK